jgi:hypothetical protein
MGMQLADLEGLEEMEFKFELGAPFSFERLMGV